MEPVFQLDEIVVGQFFCHCHTHVNHKQGYKKNRVGLGVHIHNICVRNRTKQVFIPVHMLRYLRKVNWSRVAKYKEEEEKKIQQKNYM